jgi:hypothetical protein
MKKVKYLLFVLSLITAVGFAYATAILKAVPDSFNWEEDDE